MTQYEVYDTYLHWLRGSESKSFSEVFQISFGNCSLSETVSRLFYIVPEFVDGLPRCFIFFEEDEFEEDAWGDLIPIKSSWHIVEQ